jgi:uncharacterized membrane protein YphA (DoxX/SURF4 family)
MHSVDVAALLARLLLGFFFLLARFRFFFDPAAAPGDRWFCAWRHESLIHKMAYCGLKKKPVIWAWITALVEVLAGMALIVGLLTPLAALGLLVLLLVATRCTARQKVMEQKPVDKVDCVACYLWRVEGLYIGLAILILLLGPGAYSLDAWLS